MYEEPTERNRPTKRHTEILAGTLVGLGVIALVQMLSVQSLDVPLKVSVYSFAVSIPSLSAVFLILLMVKTRSSIEKTLGKRFAMFHAFLLIGYLSSIVGISGLFFHFTMYAGILFVASCLIGLVVCINHA